MTPQERRGLVADLDRIETMVADGAIWKDVDPAMAKDCLKRAWRVEKILPALARSPRIKAYEDGGIVFEWGVLAGSTYYSDATLRLLVEPGEDHFSCSFHEKVRIEHSALPDILLRAIVDVDGVWDSAPNEGGNP